MPDLGKVIRGLECCRSSACPADCPYLSVNMCIPRLCDDAIALLREPEKIEWISVAERLPKPLCQCLVYSDKSCSPRGMETATYTKFGWMTAAYFPEITHWMPLPEPPEERK